MLQVKNKNPLYSVARRQSEVAQVFNKFCPQENTYQLKAGISAVLEEYLSNKFEDKLEIKKLQNLEQYFKVYSK